MVEFNRFRRFARLQGGVALGFELLREKQSVSARVIVARHDPRKVAAAIFRRRDLLSADSQLSRAQTYLFGFTRHDDEGNKLDKDERLRLL